MTSYVNATSAGGGKGGQPDSVAGAERLRIEARLRRTEPFLLTVTAERRPHCGTVTVGWDASGERLILAPPPTHWDRAEAAGCRQVSVLWPPSEPGGYSLIVEGTAETADCTGTPALSLTVSRAVLYRRGSVPSEASAASEDASCHSDCIPVL